MKTQYPIAGPLIGLIRELSYDIPFFKYLVYGVLLILPERVFNWLRKVDTEYQFGG